MSTQKSTVSNKNSSVTNLPKPQRVQSPVINNNAVRLNKSPVTQSIKSPAVEGYQLGTAQIPKPKSPQGIMKGKSP